MGGLARTKFLRQRVPLAARAQDVQDAGHHLAAIRRWAAPDMFPILPAAAIARLRLRQQRFDSFPEAVRQFPASDVGVLRMRLFRCFAHACILLPKQV